MKNYQSPRLLWGLLAIEVFIGVFFLIFSESFGSILSVILLLVLVGGGIFFLVRNGMLHNDWSGVQYPHHNQRSQYQTNPGWQNISWNNPIPPVGSNTGSFAVNVGLNINPGFERSETFSQEFPLSAETSSLQVDVNNGNLKVTGEAGLNHIKLNAVKRVWERDETAIRRELDRLQVRSRQEGGRLIIEAGQFDNQNTAIGINVSLGKPPRIDLELLVPPALAANFSTNTGNLDLNNLESEIAARTLAGAMNIINISGGHNLTIGTNSGRIAMQQITAGIVRARATTGTLDLTAIGADALELETMAGTVRTRGVNCGRLNANASTGSVELIDVNCDGVLQLRATAGRVQTDNIRAASFNIETTTGTVRYRGTAPTAPSQVQTGVGSSDLIFAPGANFMLEARSNVGSVQVMLPTSGGYSTNRNWFRGQIGVGGPLLNVTSQVGSVRISQG